MLIDNNLVRQERDEDFIALYGCSTLPEKIRKDDACLKFITKSGSCWNRIYGKSHTPLIA